MNRIAARIVEARKNKGLTQVELAEQATISLRTIQRIENAKNQPRGKTLDLICEALDMDTNELILQGNSRHDFGDIVSKIINGLFLLFLNLILMGIIGYLTIDSAANPNSILGGYLISVFLPFFIVMLTQHMSGEERIFKFGLGYIVYFVLVLAMHGLLIGLMSGLFPCLFISLAVLYYGNYLGLNEYIQRIYY